MKRIVFLLIFLPFFGYSQIKVSELTSATTVNNTDYFLLVQSGASKKVAYSVFRNDATDVASQISDSLDYYATLDTLDYYPLNDTLGYYVLTTDLTDTLGYYALKDTLSSYLLSSEFSDSIAYYMLSTQIRSEIADSLDGRNIPLITGNDYEIFFNRNDSLITSSNFTWDGNTLELVADSGNNNVMIGVDVAPSITTGFANSILGSNAGNDITTGYSNVLLGYYTGNSIVGGRYNVFVGYNAGRSVINGFGNVFIGYEAGKNETGSNKLYIENSNSSNPLIKGDFSTDELWFNTDTTHIVGHLEVDSNLYVFGRLLNDKYEVAAYIDSDSTITTSVTATGWTFLGDGANNKFTNLYSDGFSFDGDTLQFNKDVNDVRDSIEFRFSAHATTAASDVNKTILYSIQIKSSGESTYTEKRQITSKTRTITAGVYYSGPTCTTMPVFLKDGDKIQIVAKCASGTTTISTQDGKVYLREE